MSWDIYGNYLQPGYCEVHPSVHESFPCSICQAEQDRAHREYYDRDQPGPCEGCYYATGVQQACDGTCQTLPYPEWEYFKTQPDEVPPPLLPTMGSPEERF